MRAYSITAIFVIHFSIGSSAAAAVNGAWTKFSTGIVEGKVNCLLVAEKPQSFILAGTDKAIYRANPKNPSFHPVLQNHGNSLAIHQIVPSAGLSSPIYTATDSGVFVSRDEGWTWRNIFAPANGLARRALSVLADGAVIYVGTADGLYVRRQEGEAWQKEYRDIGQKAISHLASDGTYIYAATDSEIYRFEKSGEEVSRVYSLAGRSLDEMDVVDGELILSPQMRDMVVSVDRKKIFVVTAQKILSSLDQGASWQDVSVQGLPIQEFQKLLIVSGEGGALQLYAATDNGVFSYKAGYWEINVAGIGGISTNDLVLDVKGNMYLASEDGVYVKNAVEPNVDGLAASWEDYVDINLDFNQEPTIRDVQRMAIEYANVNPQQINSWHNQSRAKAFFPTWSMGLSRADSDVYHWDTGANPDVLVKGRDYVDWSTSLSWDFSDLIWSSDHTSIDSRSKLMSELRQDILDQVTRVYFERRRIQVELVAKADLTADTYIEKGLRLQELTALLDGLTGGEFSQH